MSLLDDLLKLQIISCQPFEPLPDDSILHRRYILEADKLYEKVDDELIPRDFVTVTADNIVDLLANKMAIIHWSQIENITEKEPPFYAVAGYDRETDRNSWHLVYANEENWYSPERDTDFDTIMDTARGTLQILTDAIYYLSVIGWLPVVRNRYFTDADIKLMTTID